MRDLAAQVEADAPALHRLLRVPSSHGIFPEVAPGAFAATALTILRDCVTRSCVEITPGEATNLIEAAPG